MYEICATKSKIISLIPKCYIANKMEDIYSNKFCFQLHAIKHDHLTVNSYIFQIPNPHSISGFLCFFYFMQTNRPIWSITFYVFKFHQHKYAHFVNEFIYSELCKQACPFHFPHPALPSELDWFSTTKPMPDLHQVNSNCLLLLISLGQYSPANVMPVNICSYQYLTWEFLFIYLLW